MHFNASKPFAWAEHVCSSTCQCLFCMCNEPSHPHIYIQALTVHLFVSVTAPWWLLLSPSRGVEGEVMIWRGESGWDVCGRELYDPSAAVFLQRYSRSGKGGWWREECHAEGGGMEILLSINRQDKGSAVNHNGPNLSHWSVVSITCWRERTVGEKQEGWWSARQNKWRTERNICAISWPTPVITKLCSKVIYRYSRVFTSSLLSLLNWYKNHP